MFSRTSGGLANQHIFYRADYIVYIESNPDRPMSRQYDSGFWQAVLRAFRPQPKYKFIPLGGRSFVEQMARLIATGYAGDRNLCALDRDYGIDPEISTLPFVLHTRGYSWENDICDQEIAIATLKAAIPSAIDEDILSTRIIEERKRFEREVRRLSQLDIILLLRGSSLFPRKEREFLKLFDSKLSFEQPTINRAAVTDILSQKKSIAYLPTSRINSKNFISASSTFDFWRETYGHLCWWMSFRAICFVAQRHFGFRIRDEDQFIGLSITTFGSLLTLHPHLHTHFREMVEKAIPN